MHMKQFAIDEVDAKQSAGTTMNHSAPIRVGPEKRQALGKFTDNLSIIQNSSDHSGFF